jgi:Arc/MetJ-type ribon-helix-helix transcriptional regulator
VLAVQRPEDRYPFVVAGRYKEMRLDVGAEKVFLWTRAQEEAARFNQSAEALVRTIQAYDAAFGSRRRNAQPFWLVECPVLSGCFTATASFYSNLLSSQAEAVSSELASFDTLMIDSNGGVPKLAAVAPALAASWLGYGQNPGFYEQQPPLSALPAFASALGQEAIEGPSSRSETIRRALRMIPKEASADKKEDANVLRAKSFLFFFALQERYGRDVFQRAIDHMLSARQGRGFNLSDLIAAFEQETHQNVAEFERIWMKHPGVPDDFRARYEHASASVAILPKETTP